MNDRKNGKSSILNLLLGFDAAPEVDDLPDELILALEEMELPTPPDADFTDRVIKAVYGDETESCDSGIDTSNAENLDSLMGCDDWRAEADRILVELLAEHEIHNATLPAAACQVDAAQSLESVFELKVFGSFRPGRTSRETTMPLASKNARPEFSVMMLHEWSSYCDVTSTELSRWLDYLSGRESSMDSHAPVERAITLVSAWTPWDGGQRRDLLVEQFARELLQSDYAIAIAMNGLVEPDATTRLLSWPVSRSLRPVEMEQPMEAVFQPVPWGSPHVFGPLMGADGSNSVGTTIEEEAMLPGLYLTCAEGLRSSCMPSPSFESTHGHVDVRAVPLATLFGGENEWHYGPEPETGPVESTDLSFFLPWLARPPVIEPFRVSLQRAEGLRQIPLDRRGRSHDLHGHPAWKASWEIPAEMIPQALDGANGFSSLSSEEIDQVELFSIDRRVGSMGSYEVGFDQRAGISRRSVVKSINQAIAALDDGRSSEARETLAKLLNQLSDPKGADERRTLM